MVQKFKLIFLFLGIMLIGSFADELSDFNKQQSKDFKNYQKQQKKGVQEQKKEFDQYLEFSQKEYSQWQEQQKKEFQAFRDSIKKEWGNFIEPSNKKWVEYSSDGKTVAAVDFEEGTVTVEVIKKQGEANEATTQRLDSAVERILDSKGSMTAAPVATADSSKQILPVAILQNQVTLKNGEIATGANAIELVKEQAGNIKNVPLENAEGQKLVFKFYLAPDNIKKRMEPFYETVTKYCNQYDLNISHALATIHTESYFNPAAYSNCGAIGLMQLMPDKGAAEAYKALKGKNLIPSEKYLYDPEKNIELGCYYITQLKTKYFGPVISKVSSTYCSIAAYNTGPGNVAFAFTGKRKLDPAISTINSMSEQNVFLCLINKLPYTETRDYVVKVSERMKLYK